MSELFEENKKVDPDPFVLLALLLSGAGVVLQFVSTHNQLEQSKSRLQPRRDGQTVIRLREMEVALDELKSHLKYILRTIDTELSTPEKTFYESKFGIRLGVMEFERNVLQHYTQDLTKLYLAISTLSSWVSNVLQSDDFLAVFIGEELVSELGNIDDKINELIRSGAENRKILFETKVVFEALSKSLEKRLGSSN